MTLSNKNATKTYGLTTFVGGNMGTSGYTQGVGKAFVFDVDGYKVVKQVYYTGNESYQVSGKNIIDYISMDVLDMSEVELVNENLRVELLSTIMNADLTNVKKIMTDNKKGFTYLMEIVGGSKDLSFASVVQDYYSHKFDFMRDTNAIIKVMIKYGYEFTNMIEANKLIR
tara:strand:- start:886 stop:1395 length:510 start_codon:yes stop_codon:yes gene_type:complete